MHSKQARTHPCTHTHPTLCMHSKQACTHAHTRDDVHFTQVSWQFLPIPCTIVHETRGYIAVIATELRCNEHPKILSRAHVQWARKEFPICIPPWVTHQAVCTCVHTSVCVCACVCDVCVRVCVGRGLRGGGKPDHIVISRVYGVWHGLASVQTLVECDWVVGGQASTCTHTRREEIHTNTCAMKNVHKHTCCLIHCSAHPNTPQTHAPTHPHPHVHTYTAFTHTHTVHIFQG